MVLLSVAGGHASGLLIFIDTTKAEVKEKLILMKLLHIEDCILKIFDLYISNYNASQ